MVSFIIGLLIGFISGIITGVLSLAIFSLQRANKLRKKWRMLNMSKIKILLNKIEDINKFLKITSSYEGDINVYKGMHIVDGKSLLGIMSLDLSRPVEVAIITNNESEEDKFKESMKQFEIGKQLKIDI